MKTLINNDIYISFLVGITEVSDRIVLGQLVPQENPVLPGERKYGEKI